MILRSQAALAAVATVLFCSTSASQNYALQFEADTLVEFVHNPIMNTGDRATIEGWVRADPATVTADITFERWQGNAEHKWLWLWEDGTIGYIYAGSPWWRDCVPGGPFPPTDPARPTDPGVFPIDGQWHHVAFVRHRDGTWQVFRDGESILHRGPGTAFESGCWLTCDVINGVPPTRFRSWVGQGQGWAIDEWRMSSTDRYSADFIPTRGWVSDADTVFLVGFNEGQGATVHDAGPASQTGTISGGHTWIEMSEQHSFCDGYDESLAACPCSNAGVLSSGCDIPQATGGVRLDVLNQDTGPANRVTFQGSGFPAMGTPTAIVIRADHLDPASPVTFGDGLRCVGVPLVRLGANFAFNGASVHIYGHTAMAGSGTFYYQLWFRSTPDSYCTPDGFNLSSGRALVW